MPDIAPVQLGRIALTKQQLRATEIAMYRAADLIDRILTDNGVQYTKVQVPAPPQVAPPGALPPGLPAPAPPKPLGPAPTAPPTMPPLSTPWPNGGQ